MDEEELRYQIGEEILRFAYDVIPFELTPLIRKNLKQTIDSILELSK